MTNARTTEFRENTSNAVFDKTNHKSCIEVYTVFIFHMVYTQELKIQKFCVTNLMLLAYMYVCIYV
jgi:hypothetical protein